MLPLNSSGVESESGVFIMAGVAIRFELDTSLSKLSESNDAVQP